MGWGKNARGGDKPGLQTLTPVINTPSTGTYNAVSLFAEPVPYGDITNPWIWPGFGKAIHPRPSPSIPPPGRMMV